MKKYTVTAKVKFDIEDLNEFVAQRQATALVLKYILNTPDANYDDEYPSLTQPYFAAGDIQIQDEDGKVLVKFAVESEEDEESSTN